MIRRSLYEEALFETIRRGSTQISTDVLAAFEAAIGFCPEKECPSNSAYVVCGRTFYRVTLQKGRYCAHCGEVLETCCPECGAPLNEGACCVACGKQYV